MPERRSRVLLADDQPVTLAGLCKLLEPMFEVIGRVTDGQALLAAAELLRPDVVIADIEMPGLDGIEATRRLRAVLPNVKTLVLGISIEPSCVRAAFDAGAWGYLPKTAVPEEIGRALNEVLAGRFYISPGVVRSAIARAVRHSLRLPSASAELFTPREIDVIRSVSQDPGNPETESKLDMTLTTLRSHLNKIFDKLSLGSRVELAPAPPA